MEMMKKLMHQKQVKQPVMNPGNDEKGDALEACKTTCHECPQKDEVENYKEDIDVEKQKLIMKI